MPGTENEGRDQMMKGLRTKASTLHALHLLALHRVAWMECQPEDDREGLYAGAYDELDGTAHDAVSTTGSFSETDSEAALQTWDTTLEALREYQTSFEGFSVEGDHAERYAESQRLLDEALGALTEARGFVEAAFSEPAVDEEPTERPEAHAQGDGDGGEPREEAGPSGGGEGGDDRPPAAPSEPAEPPPG